RFRAGQRMSGGTRGPRPMTRRATILASVLLSVAGCTVGPNHVPPKTEAPPAWPEPLAGGMSQETADLRTWWHGFNDQMLDSLVDRALNGSLDLREAAARVDR